MTKLLLHTRKTVDQTGEKMTLDYFLLAEEVDTMELYGVEIVLHHSGREEHERCVRVTPLAARMTDLIASLAAQTVTPCTLREQLLDLL